MTAMERRWLAAVPLLAEAHSEGVTWPDRQECFANLLERAATDVGDDMPRDIQKVLFDTAMKEQSAEREELARLLHDRRPRTLQPAKPG
jgi:hypothetical protein